MKNITQIFQISVLFIGTIVGAGLASGREILNFFSLYGYNSYKGLFITFLFYILAFYMIIDISYKYNLKSYSDYIEKICNGFIGSLISILMTIYILSSSSIILAGSGALFNEFLGLPKMFGIIFMIVLSIFVLKKNTSGLILINSIIVPSLIAILVTTFISYIFSNKINFNSYILNTNDSFNSFWLFSSLIYASFNILSCSGVIIPASKQYKNKNNVLLGIFIGALFLTIISSLVNFMILDNYNEITFFEIPLLFIAKKSTPILKYFIVIIIWLEMFSTKVSDLYSLSNTFKTKFKLNFDISILIILSISIPLSMVGFSKLIQILYPLFGCISLIFLCLSVIFYFKDSSK